MSSQTTHTAALPLTAAQRGIWFAQQLIPDIPIVTANYVELHGDLDIDLLDRVCRRGLAEVECLVRIIDVEGVPHQLVDRSADDDFPVIDVSDTADPEAAAAAWMTDDYTAGFDLTGDRLIRGAVIRLGDRHHYWYSCIHHIVVDGYGAIRFMNRAAELYSAELSGADAPTDAYSASSLADVVAADADYRGSRRFQLDRAHWIEKARGLPSPVSLSGTPAAPDITPVRCAGSLSPDLEARLTDAAAAYGSIDAAVTVAAVAAYFAIVTDTSDVVLSLPVTARTNAVLRRAAGMVSNVVPIRVNVDHTTTIGDLVTATGLELTGALRHQRYRSEDLRADLAAEDLAGETVELGGLYGPTINVMNFPTALRLGPVDGRFHILTSGPVSDLSISLYPGADGTTIELHANHHVYQYDWIAEHHRRLIRVLDAFADGRAERPVLSIDVLTDAEKQALVPARGPGTDEPGTLADIVEDATARDPERLAILAYDAEGGHACVTYREVLRWAVGVAGELADRGAAPGEYVAIALPRSLDSVRSVWATALSGAAFVPVDPDYPAERIRHILTDSGSRIGITSRALRGRLPDDVDWLLLDDLTEDTTVHGTDPGDRRPMRRAVLDDAAYMIYTSGSTGVPKGVVVTHRGLSALAAERRLNYRVTADSRFLHNTSPSFDMAVGEQISALSSSATLVVAPAGRTPDELSDLITEAGVTHALLTPTVLATLSPETLTSVTVLGVGGEAVTPDLVRRWAPGRAMRNGYGPTEATDIATVAALETAEPVTIGGPVHGFEIVVLDSRLRPVAPGMRGELYVAGPGLARGYHGLPPLTSTRFVANPLRPGTRMYRTGDVVSWLPGDLDRPRLRYHGRSDAQVKIRGRRIELGEIETTLARADGVAHAVVVVRDTRVGQRLVGYVVAADPGTRIIPADLRAWCERHLPTGLVPDAVVVLPRIPVTPNGKLDLAQLPEPTFAADEPFRAPSTPDEETLAAVFGEVLGHDSVGADDSFFTLGGDSIAAITLVTRARAAGLHFTPRDVFERKTVSALARAATGAAQAVHLPELPGGGTGSLPLTPIMRWLVTRTDHVDRYAQHLVLALPDGIGHRGIVDTLTAVIAHHDALRARLVGDDTLWVDDEPRFDVDALLTRIDLDGDAQITAVAQDALDGAVGRLAPRAGVMAQFVWLHRRGREDLLVVAIHHLAIDGVSWRILVPDLMTAWAAVAAGHPPALAPVGTSLRRWAHGLLERSADIVAAESEFWTTALDAVEPDPRWLIDPTRDTAARVGRCHLELGAEDTRAVVDMVPKAFRAAAEDVLVATLAVALAATPGASPEWIVLQLEGHGREESLVPGADLTRTLGWFTTTFPLPLDRSSLCAAGSETVAAQSVIHAVKLVKERIRAIPHRGAGFGLRHSPGAAPTTLDPASLDPAAAAPTASFNYLGQISAESVPPAMAALGWLPTAELGELTASPDTDFPAVAPIDINAIVTGAGEGLRLTATVDHVARLVDGDTAGMLVDNWRRILQTLATAVGDGAHGWTPSDVSPARVSQADLDTWVSQYPSITDIWPTAPLQRGFAYHAALSRDDRIAHPDAYVSQVGVSLQGRVDVERLHTATHALIARHPALRSAFTTGGDGELVAIVAENCCPDWLFESIYRLPESDRNARLAEITRTERARPFALDTAPLMRFALIQLAPERFELIVTMHHIIVDGWSMPILLRDLIMVYAAHGAATALPPAPSYRDFLGWLAGRDIDAARQAWADAFTGRTEPTLIAAATGTDGGEATTDRLILDLEPDVWQACTAAAAARGVTVNTVVQTLWGALLARMTPDAVARGGVDVTFGTTVSGRPADIDRVDETVGLFINTVPVRVRADASDTFTELMLRVQGEQAALLDHQHLGLADIVGAAGPGAEFDTLVVFESYPVDSDVIAAAGDIDGMRVTDIRTTEATHYPLTLTIETRPHPRVTFGYRPQSLSAATVAALADRFATMLKAVLAEPGIAIGALPALTRSEQQQIVPVRGNDPAAELSLRQIIRDAVDARPDGIAVRWRSRAITYRELDRSSDRLAVRLARSGARPEAFVAVAVRRSLDSVRAVWAVAKTGAAFVPVDPTYPPDRIAFMLNDSGARLGVTDRRCRPSLPDSVDWLVHDESADDPDAPADPADSAAGPSLDQASDRGAHPAYVIYTSGSTGTPKGVVVTHRGLANLVRERRETYLVHTESRFLHNTSPSFDMSVGEQLAALSASATLVISDPDDDPASIPELIVREGVTHALLTPTALAGFTPESVPGLRVLGVGGEAVGRDLVRRWSPGRVMRNGYGPTEATDIATVADLRAGTVDAGGPVPIGRPVRGFELLVLDNALRPVARGVPGELYLAGPALARGYHGRHGLTAAGFVANPFGEPGDRMYRTGDLVTLSDDDSLRYLGRSDRQVKVRGHRIELGEIEAALLTAPGIREAVTVGRTGPRGQTLLVGYIVADRSRPVPEARAVVAQVARALPRHMVPSTVVVLDSMPITPSGKVDERALPTPDFTSGAEYEAPSTPTEQLVADAFAQHLGIDRVGAHDDFFALGGTSLTAYAVARRLRDHIGADVPMTALLGYATPRTVARLLDDPDPVADSAALGVLLPIRAHGSAEPVFCIHPAIGLSWGYAGLLRHLAPDHPVHGLQIPGITDPDDSVLSIATLDDLADRYLREIRDVAPTGPIHLVGWSLGGVIAHAVAARLEQTGGQVGSLTLLDSFAPSSTETPAPADSLRFTDLVSALGLEHHPMANPGAGDRPVTRSSIDDVLAEVEDMPPGLDTATVHYLLDAAEHTAELLRRHRPPTFGGDVVMIAADPNTTRSTAAADSWRRHVRGHIAEHSVGCTHWEMCSYTAMDTIGPLIDARVRADAPATGRAGR
ncbi:amino acid adenylation domain-containing protein [Gordonia sp. NPDC003424]